MYYILIWFPYLFLIILIEDVTYDFKFYGLSEIYKKFKKSEEIIMKMEQTNLFGQRKSSQTGHEARLQRCKEDQSKFFNAMDTVVKFVCSKTDKDAWEEKVFGEANCSDSYRESLFEDKSKFKNIIEVFRLSITPSRIAEAFGSVESFTESLMLKSIEERKEALIAMHYIVPHLENDNGLNLWTSEGLSANKEDVQISTYAEDVDSLVRITNLFISILGKYFYPIAVGGKIYHSEKLDLVCSMGSIIESLASEQSKAKWETLLTEDEYSSLNAINNEKSFQDAIELFREIAKEDLTLRNTLSFKEHLQVLERINFLMIRLNDEKAVQEWQYTAIPSSANYEYFFKMASDIEEFTRIVEVFMTYARNGIGKFTVDNGVY